MPPTTALGHAEWLAEQAEGRDAADLTRRVTVRGSADALLDLAGNDYLALARHPRVIAGGISALREWGAGSTGSRLVTGTTDLHRAFEVALAEFLGAPAALVLATGYAANLAAITALSDSETLIVSDAANHASIIDACRLSRGRVVVTPHNDLAAVSRALADRSEPRALMIAESVYSADGDPAPLAALHGMAVTHGALLIVDEAHGLGVVGAGGRGGVFEAGLAGSPDVVVTVTLSKALGSQGGAVVGSKTVCEHILQSARTAIFDTALAPASVGAALAALEIMSEEPSRVLDMQAAARRLAALVGAAGLATYQPAGAVVPVVLGSAERAVAAAQTCRSLGVHVGCFRPPSVPAGASRLRLTARPDLGAADFALVGRALAAIS